VVSPVLRDSDLRSIVAVPLMSRDRFFGVLYAGGYGKGLFQADDAEMMEMLAGRVAGSLERVHLFDNERTARRDAERAFDQLAQTHRITSLLAGAVTAEQVATALARSMVAGSGSSQARSSEFWLLRNDRLVAMHGPEGGDGEAGSDHLPLEASSVTARAAREMRPVYAPVAELSRSAALTGSRSSDRASFAALPVVDGEECMGVLVVSYSQPQEFAPEEREFLSGVVAQAVQAFDRARLYVQQQQLAQVSSFFARAAKVTAEASSLADTLERLATLALEVLGDICLVDVVEADVGLQRTVALHKDPSRQRAVDRLRNEYPPDPAGDHPAAAVIRAGKVLWSEEMSDDFLRSNTRDEEHFGLTKFLGFRSYLAVPLASDGEILGAMTLVSTSRRFTRTDVSFAEALAQQVAAVVDNARQYDATSRISQVLQESLLPQELPQVPGIDVHTLYLPATSGLEIGGDFYDLIALPDGRVWFTVGDVAGHDSEAAAMMGHLRSAARTLMGQTETPAELIHSLQASWGLLGFKRIATTLCGLLDPGTGEMFLASAGHYPPLLVGPEHSHFLEVRPSPPLGVHRGRVHELKAAIAPGEILLLYTDGAIDERVLGSEKSMGRLGEIAVDGPLNARAVCDRIIDRLDVDRLDDLALMAIERRAG
ncbi:MAG: SpoIIE family protein phosphatase, partial [Acidimicrobiales bacterium]